MAKVKYSSVKTEMWGVFFVGTFLGSQFRSLKATFDNKTVAENWAKKYSEDKFGATMMVEEVKVVIPAWDGTVPNPIVTKFTQV